MNRGKRLGWLQLELVGWLLVSVLPLALIAWLWVRPSYQTAAMVVYGLGLLGFFPTLYTFKQYKHALIAASRARNQNNEAQLWDFMARKRRWGLLVACIPAWISTCGFFFGLEAIPQLLLVAATWVLIGLYRLPRLLG